MMSPLVATRALYSMLWADAPVEQRRITTQLVRNSAYFGVAIYLIRNFGDKLAI